MRRISLKATAHPGRKGITANGAVEPGPGPRVPVQTHVHVVVRTPNGNDYGKDLLRQHYQQNPHTGA